METTLFAVFGNPILHSKSPQLFNSVFNEVSMKSYYTRIRPQSAADIIEIIRTMPLAGANITAPFKEEMISLVDVVSMDAEAIGAINTIINSNGRLIGYNTDHSGVTQSLKEAGIDLIGKNCLVLGGGGAARSATYGLTRKGAQVTICNRTASKAKTIADDFSCQVMSWTDFDLSKEYDIVVSTILPSVLPHFFSKLNFKTLLDASYKPSLVSEVAQSRGINTISGKRWLLNQAVEAFTIFHGYPPPITIMEAALNKTLSKSNILVKEFPCAQENNNDYKGTNIVISSKGLQQDRIKEIIDEEISKAFAG